MNTPRPEFLRGVQPGESIKRLTGRIIIFRFSSDESYPHLRIREWKQKHGISPTAGSTIPARCWEGKRYSYWTKQPKHFVWSRNEKGFQGIEQAILFPDIRCYRAWGERWEKRSKNGTELFGHKRLWLNGVVYSSLAAEGMPSGEILLLVSSS